MDLRECLKQSLFLFAEIRLKKTKCLTPKAQEGIICFPFCLTPQLGALQERCIPSRESSMLECEATAFT